MSAAYILATPFPLTGNEIFDITTNGYKWYFPIDSPRVLNWSVSSSYWTHPILQSTETQADFTRAFGNIAEFINVQFNFLGYINLTNNLTGYENAYVSGSDLNITYARNGTTNSGTLISDGKFTSNNETAFCKFPNLNYNDLYQGAPGDTFLNYNNPFLSNATFENGTSDFSLLVHEILHGLGLKHPHDAGGTGRPTYTDLDIKYADRQWISAMSYDEFENGGDGAYKGSQPIGPMLLDAIALQYLYGESSFNSGDTTYDLTRYLGNYFNCQWDASGTDLLDASKLSYGVVVEFDGGQASNGWNTHHVGFITTALDYLALSIQNPTKWTWLWGEYENVNGSPYSDIISGNELDNVINGGSGDDYLNGGLGNDTFDWNTATRAGNDTFYGGPGNDTYVLDSKEDTVIEYFSEGVDTVWVPFSHSIAYLPNIETVRGFGVANLILTGNAGANTISGSTGNDIINGGAGTDTAGLSGNRANYTVSKTSTGWTVRSSAEGVDTLANVERLKFADTAIALDTSGVGGQAYRIYQAAFNRKPDVSGLGFWISGMDGGVSLNVVAQGFVNSAEFKTVYGASPTNAEIVTRLYDNVLHRAGESGGYSYWLGVLNSGQGSVAGVLAAFSESPENQAAVIGVIGNGILYTPYG